MLTDEQREALEIALDHLSVAPVPVALGAVCVIQAMLASAAPADDRYTEGYDDGMANARELIEGMRAKVANLELRVASMTTYNANMEADRDSWREQCSQRVADWSAEHERVLVLEAKNAAWVQQKIDADARIAALESQLAAQKADCEAVCAEAYRTGVSDGKAEVMPPKLAARESAEPMVWRTSWAVIPRLKKAAEDPPNSSSVGNSDRLPGDLWRTVLLSDLQEVLRHIGHPPAAAASEDTKRLDYLDARNARKNERHGTTYGWRLTENHNRIALEDHNWPALSVRAAIDVAIASQKEQKE